MAATPQILGNWCVLDKSCKLHKTTAGDYAVVTAYTARDEDDSVEETLTLTVWESNNGTDALKVSEFQKAAFEFRSESQELAYSTALSTAKHSTKALNGHMLKGVHAAYISDLLGRKKGSAAAKPVVDEAAEIELAQKLIGMQVRMQVGPMVGGEEQMDQVEWNDVTFYDVQGDPRSVSIMYKHDGSWQFNNMHASQAFERLPKCFHNMDVTFVGANTLAYLKRLPRSSQLNADMQVCCEEVVTLAITLGFDTEPSGTTQHTSEVACARAAMKIDVALQAYLRTQPLAEPPEGTLTVRQLADHLKVIKVIAPPSVVAPIIPQARFGSMLPPPPRAPPSPKYPRAEAIRKAAITPAAFVMLLDAVIPWFVDPSRIAAVRLSVSAQLMAFDAWLDKAGNRTAPATITSELGTPQTFDELLMFVMKIDDYIRDQASANVLAVNSLAATTSAVISHQVINPDHSGTEEQRRERANLAQHASTVASDAQMKSVLSQLSAFAQAGQHDQLFKLISDPAARASPLFALFHCMNGEDVSKACQGFISQDVSLQIQMVRGALARRVEKAFESEGQQLSEKQKSALHFVRIGRFKSCKLFNLAGLTTTDKGTADNPLQYLIDLKDGLSDAHYENMIGSLTFAWQLCTPNDIAAVSTFTRTLARFTFEQRELGATWASLSTFHAALLRKMDYESEKFGLRESNVSRASPLVGWITDPSKHLQHLQASVAKEAAKKAATDAVRETEKRLTDANKKAAASANSEASKKFKDQEAKSKKEITDLRKKLETLRKEKPPSGADKHPAQESGNAKRKRVASDQLEKHGKEPGTDRKPCYYYHGAGLTCKFSKENCLNGHHLGSGPGTGDDG